MFNDKNGNFDLGFFLYMQECLEEERLKNANYEQISFDSDVDNNYFEDGDEENDNNKIR